MIGIRKNAFHVKPAQFQPRAKMPLFYPLPLARQPSPLPPTTWPPRWLSPDSRFVKSAEYLTSSDRRKIYQLLMFFMHDKSRSYS